MFKVSKSESEFNDSSAELDSPDSDAYWLVHNEGFSPVQYARKKSSDGTSKVLVKVFGGKEYNVDEDSLEKVS